MKLLLTCFCALICVISGSAQLKTYTVTSPQIPPSNGQSSVSLTDVLPSFPNGDDLPDLIRPSSPRTRVDEDSSSEEQRKFSSPSTETPISSTESRGIPLKVASTTPTVSYNDSIKPSIPSKKKPRMSIEVEIHVEEEQRKTPKVEISESYESSSTFPPSETSLTTTTESVIEFLDGIRKLPDLWGPQSQSSSSSSASISDDRVTTESVIELLNKLRQKIPVERNNYNDDDDKSSTMTTLRTMTTEVTIEESTLSSSTTMTTTTTSLSTTTMTTTTATTTSTTTTSPTTVTTKTMSTTTTSTTLTTARTEPIRPIIPIQPVSSSNSNKTESTSPSSEYSYRHELEIALISASLILLAVIILAVMISYLVCYRGTWKWRRGFHRKNIYTTTTLESDSRPTFFTKPGPPVILQHETDAVSPGRWKKRSSRSKIEIQRITEL